MSNRLLLIEDDTRLAEMVQDYLGGAGFRVERAADAARGLALAAVSYTHLTLPTIYSV